MTQEEFDKLGDVDKEVVLMRMVLDNISQSVFIHMSDWYKAGRMPLTKELNEGGKR